jgi:CII-binding regulator of phage lambda lysogenization HflD
VSENNRSPEEMNKSFVQAKKKSEELQLIDLQRSLLHLNKRMDKASKTVGMLLKLSDRIDELEEQLADLTRRAFSDKQRELKN